ncbi:2,3-bisphosphoglycerate-dependent phosphoglycerate mutase [Halioglobus japonicus]|nr:2,3-bisphosphoglycerate-dependent phosphoglycerate mutase [Halioglobus japonicus]
MDIFLVRHGEAAASWGELPDPGLSDLGRQQAEAAAQKLQQQLGEDGALLISSPLQRAVETAAPLSTLRQNRVQIDEAFREIPSPVPLAQRQAWLRQFMQQQWHEQAEDLNVWRSRALQQLLELRESAVIFTHFLVINAVVGQLLERPETLYFWPANGSITHLRHNGTDLELVALGQELKTKVN